jgi:hypothetical protein
VSAKAIIYVAALCAGFAAGNAVAADIPFHQPEPYVPATLYREITTSCPSKQWACYEKELFSFTMTYGPKAAVDTFTQLEDDHDISTAIDPHHVVHHIGHHTAMAFGSNAQAFQLCPIDYDYGCMHGFFQYALSEGGMSKAAAAQICEKLELRGSDPALRLAAAAATGVLSATRPTSTAPIRWP